MPLKFKAKTKQEIPAALQVGALVDCEGDVLRCRLFRGATRVDANPSTDFKKYFCGKKGVGRVLQVDRRYAGFRAANFFQKRVLDSADCETRQQNL